MCLFVYLFIYLSITIQLRKFFLQLSIVSVDQLNIKKISFAFLSRLSILNSSKSFIQNKRAIAEIKIEVIKI